MRRWLIEREAVQLWCPFAQLGGSNRLMVLNEPAAPEVTKCLGSGCMAWQWKDESTEDDVGTCGLASAS
jgi:hypothetical protein